MKNTDILQPKTVLNQIETIADKSSSHAYLVSGIKGSGKHYVAKMIASELLGKKPEQIDESPAVYILDGSIKSISIDDIRSLQQFLRLKTLGSSEIRRVVVIVEAQAMTIEAQNAMLKTLEEPPLDTKLILTSSDEAALRPTIVSRVQKIHLQPMNLSNSMEFFLMKGYNKEEITEAHRLSQGAVGLMTSLLDEKDSHQLAGALKEAKSLLGQTTYEKLLQVEKLSKDREQVSMILDACKLILHVGLKQAIIKQQPHKRWLGMLADIQKAQLALAKNANSKIVLTNLFVNL